MLIGVNRHNEIMQINEITDPALEIVEIDRNEVFPGKSDIYILCCRYIRHEVGYSAPLRISYEEYLCKELKKQTEDIQIALAQIMGV